MNNKKEGVFQSQEIIKAKEAVIKKLHLEKLRLANAELSAFAKHGRYQNLAINSYDITEIKR